MEQEVAASEATKWVVRVWWWTPSGPSCKLVDREQVEEFRALTREMGGDTWVTEAAPYPVL